MENMAIKNIDFEEFARISGGQHAMSDKMMVFKKSGVSPEAWGKPFRSELLAVIMCIEGSCDLNVNMVRYRLEPGSVLIYARETVVEFVETSPDVTTYILLFEPTLLDSTSIDRNSVMGMIKYFIEKAPDTINLDSVEVGILEKIFDLATVVSVSGREQVMKNVLALMVNTISDMYSMRVDRGQQHVSRTEEYFERFLKSVSANFAKERSVAFYADALHITPKYLSTIIKEVSGKSANTWINDFVIQQAKVYLKFSGKSIQEIAYMLNFSTQSFFGKYFKRYTGISPSDFRKNA